MTLVQLAEPDAGVVLLTFTDPDRRNAMTAEMGKAGRARAEREFGWDAIARRTVEVYGSLR